jgi:MFS family permease
VLVGAGLGLAALALSYIVVARWELLVALAAVHGVLWSSQLTAAAAQAADLVPEGRRGEGMGYYGLAVTLSIAVAPPVGFGLLHLGWPWLCTSLAAVDLGLALLAARLPGAPRRLRFLRDGAGLLAAIDWRTLAVASILFLGCFGYGGLTSFVPLYAESRGIAPRSLFFVVFAGTVIVSRLLLGGAVDRFGHRRSLGLAIALVAAGQALVPLQRGAVGLALAAVVFGAGMSLISPAFSGYILGRVEADRRGAAFGAWIAAMDTGIGSGSILLGWVIEHAGFGAGFGLGAAMAALGWPAFVAAERWLARARQGTSAEVRP